MAYVSINPTAATGLFSRIKDLRAAFAAYRARRAVYHKTLTELDALSDRDLADFGLHRSELPRVALDAAREV
ncbi:DUF1127 domain-containing protein [Aestuariicoccus sp. MJ-SS9]|uniref:DUF1127 domain-containing protein n=1 Tax=Aestuariicoccus sp. MJ-SS9 TaxID=3079855 RepID=UPI002912B128|nr:DUF1127 domain-containing protein [Aestuariicoccus sp. MJ-SS9]MDU8913176.1 DUF1127 domain-containing protein [Aestuariicoccus sp. MJ-SS9]